MEIFNLTWETDRPDNTQEIEQMWPIALVDWNGVVDKYKGWNRKFPNYEPAEDAEWYLKNMKGLCKTIIIFTAAQPLERVIEWFERYNLDQYVDYVMSKPPAIIYIDDNAEKHNGDLRDTFERTKVHIENGPWWRE